MRKASTQGSSLTTIVILIFVSIAAIGYLFKGSEFNQEGTVTDTHFYGTPYPDPNREIDHFSHTLHRYIYKDELPEPGPIPHREPIQQRRTKRQRLVDELILEITDEVQTNVEMERN